jgi:hypothetical protein
LTETVTEYLTPEEELAIIDKRLRAKGTPTAQFLQLQSRRDNLLKKTTKQQGVANKTRSVPLTNEQRFLETLKDPFEREVWENVFRLEEEARAQRQPEARAKTVVPALPKDIARYGPEGKPIATPLVLERSPVADW